MNVRKGYIVREKGYEYNDNWYDHDPTQDKYTNLFNDLDSAIKHAKETTADFIADRSVYDYFNEKDYLEDIKDIVEGEEFESYDINSDKFTKLWELIKDDISCVLEAEILEGDPCIVTHSDGTKMYYKDNVLHRIDGPAIERADGSWEYFYKGKRHRIDGPAISSQYDDNYYVEDKYYWNKEEFAKAAGLWIQQHRDSKINEVIG